METLAISHRPLPPYRHRTSVRSAVTFTPPTVALSAAAATRFVSLKCSAQSTSTQS
ncbi:hypothetical protein Tco_1300329, partial [Tanacetum coccineum]